MNVVIAHIQDPLTSHVALGCEWTHMGVGEARTGCKPMALRVKAFPKSVKESTIIHEISWTYARCFHARLVTAEPPREEYPTDLRVPSASYDELVVSMPDSMQVFLSLGALQILRKKSGEAEGSCMLPGSNIGPASGSVTLVCEPKRPHSKQSLRCWWSATLSLRCSYCNKHADELSSVQPLARSQGLSFQVVPFGPKNAVF